MRRMISQGSSYLRKRQPGPVIVSPGARPSLYRRKSGPGDGTPIAGRLRMQSRHVVTLAVAALVLVSRPSLTATEPPAPQYAIEAVGDFGPDTYAYVTGINRHGDVVGWVQSLIDYGQVRAWRKLHGATAPEILRCCGSRAMAINDAGVVVGYDALSSGSTTSFRYSDQDGVTEIEALKGFQAAAAAITDAGAARAIIAATSGM